MEIGNQGCPKEERQKAVRKENENEAPFFLAQCWLFYLDLSTYPCKRLVAPPKWCDFFICWGNLRVQVPFHQLTRNLKGGAPGRPLSLSRHRIPNVEWFRLLAGREGMSIGIAPFLASACVLMEVGFWPSCRWEGTSAAFWGTFHFHSFQDSFFLENPPATQENGETDVEKNHGSKERSRNQPLERFRFNCFATEWCY